MDVALKAEIAPETVDPLLEKLMALTGVSGMVEKHAWTCEEAFTEKGFYNSPGGFDQRHKGYGDSYMEDATEYLYLNPGFSPPTGADIVREFAPTLKGCIGLVDMVGALGLVEKMEAKPKVQAKKAASSSETATLRAVRPAPELYPDLDLDRIQARAAELRAASSDSEAISMVLGRSVQIVIHSDE